MEDIMVGVMPYKDQYPKLAEGVFIAAGAWIIGDVNIGRDSSIWFNTIVRGDVHYIRIGMETNVQDNSTLHVTGGRFPLNIGDRVTIGHRAIVHGCTVEDDCLIGMGAVVMDGAKIGRGSLVAAGSVVTPGTLVPEGSLVVGIPAVVKKPVSDLETRLIQEAASHYIGLAKDYLQPPALDQHLRVRGFLG
jgi:carbonic anhydrase/acetyltransferase-like protein (isoleucine patch superfamily)